MESSHQANPHVIDSIDIRFFWWCKVLIFHQQPFELQPKSLAYSSGHIRGFLMLVEYLMYILQIFARFQCFSLSGKASILQPYSIVKANVEYGRLFSHF